MERGDTVNLRLTTMILVTCSGIAIAMPGLASPIVPPTSKLLASDGADWDQFGSSVAISGDVAAIGSPNDDDNGEDSGAVYVFRFNGSTWIKEAKLSASDASSQLQATFGLHVAVSGDLIVVHARNQDNGSASGAAYVYRCNGANWVEEAKQLASDGAIEDEFGSAVSVDGDVILVGARENDQHGDNAGAAYVFRFNGSNWSEEAKLIGADTNAGDLFGNSAALSGATAVFPVS